MLKAVFMDFYGTAVYETGPIAEEVARRICKNSHAGSPEEVFRYWWKAFREILKDANGECFQTQHDAALKSFQDILKHFSSPENPRELLERMEAHWRTAAAYEDTRAFMDAAPVPIYFVTNSDDNYVAAAIEYNGLRPAGVITSEQAKYSKPRKEIFLYALEKTGLKADEVIHIGDSLQSDVECPALAGIRSIWLNRKNRPVPSGVVSANQLSEVLKILEREASPL